MRWLYKLIISSCICNYSFSILAQSGTANLPSCNDCIVRLYKDKHPKKLYIGYDNIDKREYVSTNYSARIFGKERIIFLLCNNKLEVYSFIPQASREILDDIAQFHRLSKIYQHKNKLDLYTPSYLTNTVPIVLESNGKIIDSIKFSNVKIMSVSLKDSFEVQAAHIETKPISNRQLIDYYRNYTKPRWYWELHGTLGASYRAIQVTNSMPDRSEYESRYKNDRAGFSWMGAFKSGININANNSFYAEISYLFQELRTQGDVDWDTGLTTGGKQMLKQKWQYIGTEVGYSIESFRHRTSICLDVGMNLKWAMKHPSTNRLGVGPHFGLGLKTRMGTSTDLRIMPTINFNLLSIEKQLLSKELATKMFTAGIKIAVRKYQM